MQSFDTITAAYEYVLGRKRKRNEVENGTTDRMVGTERVRESEYCKYADIQHFADNYRVWHKRIPNGKRLDTIVNNYLLDEPLHLLVGGEFAAERTVKRRVKVRAGMYTYRDVTETYNREVAYAGLYKLVDVVDDGEYTTITAERVED